MATAEGNLPLSYSKKYIGKFDDDLVSMRSSSLTGAETDFFLILFRKGQWIVELGIGNFPVELHAWVHGKKLGLRCKIVRKVKRN